MEAQCSSAHLIKTPSAINPNKRINSSASDLLAHYAKDCEEKTRPEDSSFLRTDKPKVRASPTGFGLVSPSLNIATDNRVTPLRDDTKTTEAKGISFMNLPRELRDNIYRFGLLNQSRGYWGQRSLPVDEHGKNGGQGEGIKVLSSVRRVSKGVSEEALDVLYGENLSETSLASGSGLTNRFTARNLQRIRHFRLFISSGFSCLSLGEGAWQIPDSKIWSPFLQCLNHLDISIPKMSQMRPGRYTVHLGYEPEGPMGKKWLAWIEVIMQFIAERVSSNTRVKLCTGENYLGSSKKAMKSMKKHFPRHAIVEIVRYCPATDTVGVDKPMV